MKMIQIKDEYIKLGQAMKLGGLVQAGSDAAAVIASGAVRVNGEEELRRGRKLYVGDRFEFEGEAYEIASR